MPGIFKKKKKNKERKKNKKKNDIKIKTTENVVNDTEGKRRIRRTTLSFWSITYFNEK